MGAGKGVWGGGWLLQGRFKALAGWTDVLYLQTIPPEAGAEEERGYREAAWPSIRGAQIILHSLASGPQGTPDSLDSASQSWGPPRGPTIMLSVHPPGGPFC